MNTVLSSTENFSQKSSDSVYTQSANTPPAALVKVVEEGRPSDKILQSRSFWMMVLVASPRLPLQMALAAQWAGIGPYLQNLLPSWAVQMTQLIGPTFGILVAPTVGVLSDNCTSKFGRRRPFILFGAVSTIVCWTLMGFTKEFGAMCGDDTPKGDRFWTAFFMILLYAWMDITVNVAHTPAKLLIADMAGNRQTSGAAIGQALSVLGNLFVSAHISIWGAPSKHLHAFLGMLSGIMLLIIGSVCLFVKEKPLIKPEESEKRTCTKFVEAFSSIWEGIITLPRDLKIYAVIFLMAKFGFTAYNGMKAQFFGLEVFGGSADRADICGQIGKKACTAEQDLYNKGVKYASGHIDIAFNVFGYFFAFLLPYLVHRLGSKKVLMLGLFPQVLFMVMAVWHNLYVDVAIVVSVAMTVSVIYTMIVPVVLHVVKKHENDSPNIGKYVGAINSANCAGQFLTFLQSSAFVNFGHEVPIFIGGVVSAMCLVVTFFFFKINFKSY